jgi:adenylate kinase family enzyme
MTGRRILVLGNGGSGKSTFGRALSAETGIPLTELDKVFWSADLQPTPPEEWRERQVALTAADEWILDGDLGPYDQLDVRLAGANTIVLFDLPTRVCAWRAFRRSRQRLDFWRWLLTWRRRSLPLIRTAISLHAPSAELIVIRNQRDLGLFESVFER